MAKAIALLALSLSLEAAFLFQIAVIARPERVVTPTTIAEVVLEADGETVAQSPVSVAPRS
jgi:hypothetical protein